MGHLIYPATITSCHIALLLILCSPPHSVAIKMKELEDIFGPSSKFALLLSSQGIIWYKH